MNLKSIVLVLIFLINVESYPYIQNLPVIESPNFGREFSNNGFKTLFSKAVLNKYEVCLYPQNFGFIQRPSTNYLYSIADLQMPWLFAEDYCLSFGGHLPVIHISEDLDFLRSLIGERILQPNIIPNSNSSDNGYWLGAYYSIDKKKWKWVDGYNNLINIECSDECSNYALYDKYIIEKREYQGVNNREPYAYLHVICEVKC
ncbi:unnamed protein product [Brachionus calyciflorus]|uniref:C-type lectin domain-containing protein n=1 Tax=Brachionus calyciflorus TaxID=104777 RepID=A0A813N7K1_9BILA|nr:unnamed protein product [Brachionus calyciflorus]